MRRSSLPLVILICIVIAAVLAWLVVSRGFPGSGGEVTAVPRTTAPFQRIEVSGALDLVLIQGADDPILVEAPRRTLDRVTTEVTKGTLTISYNDDRRWWNSIFGSGATRAPRVVVSFRELESIESAGIVSVSARALRMQELRFSGSGGTSLKVDNLQAKVLRLSGAGATKVEIAGRVDEQQLTFSGAGDYRGEKLVSQNAVVSVSGAARVIVNAEQTLKASISGAGVVEFLGDPKVTEQISGAGRVRKRNALEHPQRQFAALALPAIAVRAEDLQSCPG